VELLLALAVDVEPFGYVADPSLLLVGLIRKWKRIKCDRFRVNGGWA
jgi:hypothetical protein